MTREAFISFGTVLKEFRTRRELTQQKLAEKLGVRRNTIGSWERGDFLPQSKGIVLELARYLHLDDEEIRQLLEASLTLAPYWLVPLLRNPYFTGREEILEALHTRLGADRAVALTQSSALHGLGGIGKTQIALEYAYRHALEYSAVFWIGAETDEQVIASLLHIGEVLQLPEQEDTDQQKVVAAVQRWLSGHGQWLLIWDNVEDLDVLRRFLPSTRSGAILLTTRCQALGTLAQGLDLLPMEQEEAILFLLRRAKVLTPDTPDTPDEQTRQFARQASTQYMVAADLVTELGGLPLALDQAGAYLEETRCGLPVYLDLFRSHRTVLLQQRGEEARDHPASVSMTLTLAIMATARRHPAVRDILHVCALLQPDAIPEELFRQGGEHLGSTLEAVCRDPLEWNRVVRATCAYSLLARQPEAHTLSLHRLVQAVLLDSMAEAEQEQWRGRIIKALNLLFPEVTHDAWEQCERLLPHILTCATTLPNQGTHSEELVEVLQKAADYLCVRAQYKQAEPLYQRALAIREQALEPEHSDLAALLGRLAKLYSEMGKHIQAELFYRRALAIQERTLGLEHPEVALLLDGLANLFFQQGKYEQAESLYQQALQIREQTLGLEHALVAHSLYGLAHLSQQLGKYEQAESLHQRALQIRERILGPEHPDLAASLHGLAVLYVRQGQYTKAEPLLQQALQIWERALGPEHIEVAGPLYSLAVIYEEQGMLAQAESLHQRALQIWERALGLEHPQVAATLNGLANLSLRQGKLEQAESLGQRALQIWERALGAEHPHVGYPLDTLSDVYYEQGKWELAESLGQRALQIWELAWGAEHPVVAIVLNKHANHYLAQGKGKQAEPLYQRALRIREQHSGLHHSETAETLHDLAVFYQKQGNLCEALSLAERALSIRSQALGEAHSATVATRTLYQQLLQEQKYSQEERTAELSPEANKEAQALPPLRADDNSPPTENDLLQGFLMACCERHPRAWCRSADLWQAYEQWSREQQERYPLSRMAFTRQVKAAGYRASRTNSARIWWGITLVGKWKTVTGSDRK